MSLIYLKNMFRKFLDFSKGSSIKKTCTAKFGIRENVSHIKIFLNI